MILVSDMCCSESLYGIFCIIDQETAPPETFIRAEISQSTVVAKITLTLVGQSTCSILAVVGVGHSAALSAGLPVLVVHPAAHKNSQTEHLSEPWRR